MDALRSLRPLDLCLALSPLVAALIVMLVLALVP
jgi:hypothetical protein